MSARCPTCGRFLKHGAILEQPAFEPLDGIESYDVGWLQVALTTILLIAVCAFLGLAITHPWSP